MIWHSRKRQDKQSLNILLITNCDSDNLGDQVIEACDIGLLRAVMNNLGVSQHQYKIISKPAGMVTETYAKTQDVKLLGTAENNVKQSDIIVFGGAPMFNYKYQIFYERTATILDLAKKYNKPVIFSAVGIENYDEDDEKCQRLKKALNYNCVKQITTRDGFDELTKYRRRKEISIAKVADPAVFTDVIFKNYRSALTDSKKKTVGIFVLRASGFVDNGVPYNRHQSAEFWLQLARELKDRNLDYQFITSGHVADEAFLDYLIREKGVPYEKTVFNMNKPEKLVEKISSYDAVISTRLHPSIISYSLQVPSIGLVWNEKVRNFYRTVGHPDRAYSIMDITPAELADSIVSVMQEGNPKNSEYEYSVYQYLFSGIKRCLTDLKYDKHWNPDAQVWSYEEVRHKCEGYSGTSSKAQETKLRRKFRRIYNAYNMQINRIETFKSREYVLHYHSGRKGRSVTALQEFTDSADGVMKRLNSGALEFTLNKRGDCDHPDTVSASCYRCRGYEFTGWTIRFRVKKNWYWILQDGSFCEESCYDNTVHTRKIFLPGEQLPIFTLPEVQSVVAEAQWTEK